MRALVIEHDHASFPGPIGERLAERGYELDELIVVPEERHHTPDVAVDFPDPADYDLIAPFGSPWSVYDHARIGSWLLPELDLLRRAHTELGLPVLAVCFGAQALATALGGRTERSPGGPEIGWTEVETDDPSLVPAGPWFQWHYDRFAAPPGATVLARTAIGPQAYRIGRSLALQFHPELNEATLQAWYDMGGTEEARQHGFDPEAMMARTRALRDESRKRAHALVDAFLDQVAQVNPGA